MEIELITLLVHKLVADVQIHTKTWKMTRNRPTIHVHLHTFLSPAVTSPYTLPTWQTAWQSLTVVGAWVLPFIGEKK